MNLSRTKTYIFILLLYSLPLLVHAQQDLTIKGIIFIKSSSERVSQATITNMSSRDIMMSDELGGFTIKAAKGDTLLFNRTNYTPQKLAITSSDDIAVYLQPIIHLADVVVKEQSKKQELNSVMNTYRSKGLYYDGKPPVLSFLFTPLTAVYELLSSDAKHERHFVKFSKNEMEAIEVSRRYTKDLVKRITNLPDDEVVKFMQQYTPSYEDVMQWNDYELVTHIKKYFEYYKKHKDGIKLQKLY